MAKSWSGFTPQNQVSKKQWKLLELCQALGPEFVLFPAEPEEQQRNSQEDEDLMSQAKAAEHKSRRH